MKKHRLFLLAALVAVCVSCGSPDKVNFGGVEDFTMTDETHFDVTVRIENRNGNNLRVTACRLALLDGRTEMVALSLDRKVVIPRHSNGSLVFPVGMRLSDPGALSSLGDKIRTGVPLVVTGKVTGASGIFSKSYRIGPMPLDEFLGKLDDDNRDLILGFIL